ncbi:MAG TPA: ATP synthase F0 subunit B [Planktothrix sp.]|jgi:F-type H+-transporting ATPase subunit b
MNASYLILAFVLSFGAIALFRYLNLGAIFSIDATMPIFIVMFGVFIHLLNKMVLQPVGQVMEKRRERIAADIAAGSTARATGTEVVASYNSHIQKARHEGQAIVNDVTVKAQQAKQAEIQRVLQQGSAKLEAAKQEIAQERTAVVANLVEDEKELVTTIVKKLVGSSANVFVDSEKARRALAEETR